MKKVLAYLMLVLLFVSCEQDSDIPSSWNEQNNIEDIFPNRIYSNPNNLYSTERFELGKDLFYDPILSLDSTISCGSCHHPLKAFSDSEALSFGVGDSIGLRNTPALMNLAWQPHFNWDGGVNHIEIFAFAPITNPLEMDMDINDVLYRLNSSESYKQKFQESYLVDSIDDQHLYFALTNFMIELISNNSKYDKVQREELEFSEQEQRGYDLFLANCESCHKEPMFTSYEFKNNGIDSEFLDEGRYRITQNEGDLGKFKIPTLRNIEFSNPYMHDGRFNTLEEVVDHYSEGIVNSPTVDITSSMNFTGQEKEDLIKFLKTLSDVDFITNEDFFNNK